MKLRFTNLMEIQRIRKEQISNEFIYRINPIVDGDITYHYVTTCQPSSCCIMLGETPRIDYMDMYGFSGNYGYNYLEKITELEKYSRRD